MRLRSSALALAALVGAVAAPAHAQNALDRADIRCILVLGVVKGTPEVEKAAAQGTFYFLGRLAAHGMSPRLQELIDSEQKQLPSERFTPELSRCGAELTQRSNELQTAYKNLKAAEEASQKRTLKPVGK
jgi:hypothetical protein